ncbi:MAG TPA: hypothetical protein VKM55_03365 [Candidatus Lokiarchaeia archaeon]|nr:hypothetical protein [Candidatus Lokiarchaeia archaeon]
MEGRVTNIKDLNANKFLEKKIFDNEKLLLYNYLASLLKIDIEDLVILAKTIFILVTNGNYENVPFKTEIKTILKLILDKITFLVPLSDDMQDLLVAVYENSFIENIETRVETNCVRVKIWLKPALKTEFFHKYKKIFTDISKFFEIIYDQEFKFQFL